MVSRLNIAAEGEKAERRASSGRRHAGESRKLQEGDSILNTPVRRRSCFGGVVATAIFGPASLMLAGS